MKREIVEPYTYICKFIEVFFFCTYLTMTEDQSKRRFLSVVFTVLSFGKPLLIRLMIGMGINSIYICIEDPDLGRAKLF